MVLHNQNKKLEKVANDGRLYITTRINETLKCLNNFNLLKEKDSSDLLIVFWHYISDIYLLIVFWHIVEADNETDNNAGLEIFPETMRTRVWIKINIRKNNKTKQKYFVDLRYALILSTLVYHVYFQLTVLSSLFVI